MFNHNDLLIEKLARAHHAEQLTEAEISRLPVAQAAKTNLSKHKLALALMGALLTALLMAQLVAAATGGVTDPVVLKDLAEVRQATAKCHDVNNAIADGYLPTTTCVAEPGVGGMGFHYVNVGRAIDPGIDLTAPEILLYASAEGELKLVGVEYFYGIGAPDAPVPDPAPPAPILFGRPFDGPMPGHKPGMPPHYDLHVWLWRANPGGTFAPFNPNVSCP